MSRVSTYLAAMIRLALALLIATTASALPESHYQKIAAAILGGKIEVTMPDRTRCDIVTNTHAIEVDWSKNWAESIGQSLNYAFQTNLRGGIILIIDTPTETKEALRINSLIVHYKLPIDLWTIDKETEALRRF
tara:strand:- start:6613 stop:7014 length:402 start_codon:yes stop_codon:yes gene_type:complete